MGTLILSLTPRRTHGMHFLQYGTRLSDQLFVFAKCSSSSDFQHRLHSLNRGAVEYQHFRVVFAFSSSAFCSLGRSRWYFGGMCCMTETAARRSCLGSARVVSWASRAPVSAQVGTLGVVSPMPLGKPACSRSLFVMYWGNLGVALMTSSKLPSCTQHSGSGGVQACPHNQTGTARRYNNFMQTQY